MIKPITTSDSMIKKKPFTFSNLYWVDNRGRHYVIAIFNVLALMISPSVPLIV